MDSKTKILIGILIVGVVLISGWWIWINSPWFLAKQIIITTDKAEYFPDELVKVKIESKLKQTVYINPTFLVMVEVLGKGKIWTPVRTAIGMPCECFPEVECDEKGFSSMIEIKPLEFYNLVIAPECFHYRITNSNYYRVKINFHIKEKDGEKYKVCSECYSNEFTIKEKEEVTITKEQAIAIASQTEEFKEFLKLYPDANVIVEKVEEGYCTVTSKVAGDDVKIDCNTAYGKESGWIVAYYFGDSWEYSKSTAVRIGIDGQMGKILAKYPKLEYIKNSQYCESESDCKYIENCLIPRGVDDFGDTIYAFEGCLNFISGKAYCDYEREGHFCKCINNTCIVEK